MFKFELFFFLSFSRGINTEALHESASFISDVNTGIAAAGDEEQLAAAGMKSRRPTRSLEKKILFEKFYKI